MDRTLFTLPILEGKAEAARAFLDELEGERKGQYAESEQRLKLFKEVWSIQTLPPGDSFVVYFEGEDIGRAFQSFAGSRDDFDVWFKQQVKATTGADLNVPPTAPMSEILSAYEA